MLLVTYSQSYSIGMIREVNDEILIDLLWVSKGFVTHVLEVRVAVVWSTCRAPIQ